MTQSNQFKPSLGLLDATLLVAGSMIGSGIFIVSADITRHVGSAGWLLVVWLITGFMTLTAALSYGELSAMFPKAGGQYVYLKESYNPLVGFLYGWSFFSVIQTGTIAAVAVAFSKFTGTFIDVFDMTEANFLFQVGAVKIYPAQLLAIGTILLLTYINTMGVEGGKKIQTFFTAVKLLSLFGLIVLGFAIGFKSSTWQANFTDAFNMQSLSKVGESFSSTPVVGVAMLGAMAAAMVGSIFSSDAWNNVTFIAGEVKNPSKNIGLSLLLGTLIVTCIYLLANVMYLGVLPLNDIAFAQQDRVANAASAAIFGSWGSYIIAAMIMISTFGCNNGLILAGARVYYSMAKDGLFFAKAGELNKNSVPAWALWAQAVVASLLCLSGRYGDLLDMVSCIVVLFYALTIFGIFILRKKQPNTPRPYRAFGYPVLPAIYIAMATVFCGLLVAYKPEFTWPGLGITALGIPIYFFVKRSKN